MEYVQEITLDLNTNTAYTTIGAKQGDNRSRVILVHLTNEGETITIDPSSQAYFRFRKPDGKVVVNAATIQDNAVRIVLTAQTLAVAGRGYADITLQNGVGNISTVSFIIIIMASPQISKEVESSSEFGYLNAVVGDATNIIYEAESWAAGTRGGVAVASDSSFQVSCSSDGVIATASAIPSVFMGIVGEEPGLKRQYTFTYIADNNWWKECQSINGISTAVSDKELINNIADYGITYTPEIIDQDDQIYISIEEPDPAYQNNAKYYAEEASAAASEAIQALSSTVQIVPQTFTLNEQATARSNIGAQVAGNYQPAGDYIAAPSSPTVNQFLKYISGNAWVTSTIDANDVGAIPSILTSYYYGTELPSDPVEGRLFFLRDADE